MNYFLFKLSFDSMVHFGASDSALSLYTSEMTFRADTLFSALCHTAISLYGPQAAQELCDWVRRDELRLSDAMPWCGEAFYLPKPCVAAENDREVPAKLRKAMKKVAWIPVSALGEFAESLHGGEMYNAQKHHLTFGRVVENSKVSIVPGADPEPYQVGGFRFAEDCGLYILVGCADLAQEKRLDTLMRGLGLSGIGGKISAGYGKFHVEKMILLEEPSDDQTKWFCDALHAEEAERQMLLTTCLPADDELAAVLEGATFQMERRGGFVQSDRYAETARKKRTQYFLASGAVLSHRFKGDLFEVGGDGTHPVCRYGKPIFVGVTL